MTVERPRRVVVVGYPAAELLDIACVTTALQLANWLHGKPVYQVCLASPGGRPIHTSSGITVSPQATLERVTGPLDTLIVSGGIGYVDALDDRRLVGHVRRLAHESRRVASVCTGSGVLAAAGLLDGRAAATHWDHAEFLARRFPRVRFHGDRIYVADGCVLTSAGVTAALDLTLSLIEDDVGAELAHQVSRQLVTLLRRPGDHPQLSLLNAQPAPARSVVAGAVEHVIGHLAGDLSTGALATRAGVSVRHLTRLFQAELGVTPSRFVRHTRAEAAARLLASTDLTMDAIAVRCGFGTTEALRTSFKARYAVSPSHYRLAQSAAPLLVEAAG
jgi:transcriptional regulator GlxA family with amidase domain